MTDVTAVVRPSPRQEHLWLLREGDGPWPYVAWCSLRLTGSVDRDRLAVAIAGVAGRHEILRTALRGGGEGEGPSVHVEAPVFPRLALHDLRDQPVERRGAVSSQLYERLAAADDGPEASVLRCVLIALPGGEHRLWIGLPAWCCDRPGLALLAAEIGRALEAGGSGAAPDEEPLQYADVAAWQDELLTSPDTAVGRDYWAEEKISQPGPVALPGLSASGPEARAFEPRRIVRELPDPVQAKIRDLLARRDVSAEALFLACWQVLVGRVSGSREPSVGVAFDGRALDELASALGPLTRFLPVAAELRPETRFADLLSTVAGRLEERREWQDYFSWRQVLPAGDAGEPAAEPWFPIAYEYFEVPAARPAGEVELSVDEIYACGDRFQVRLVVHRRGSGFELELHHDAGRLPRPVAIRLAGRLAALLREVAERPGATLASLADLDPVERHQLLVELNDTAVPASRPRDVIHRRVERQVARTPDRVALVAGSRHVSYGELRRRSRGLAARLTSRGVSAEQVVGLAAARSPELVTAVLGILAAGAAYLPLDPEYPAARLELMLRDARARVLVRGRRQEGSFRDHDVETVLLDGDVPSPAPGAEPPTVPEAGYPARLAYVIYTSGSTGRPKGVMVPHGAVLNFFDGMDACLGAVSPGDTWLALTSLSFDISVLELLWTLTRGFRVVIRDEARGITLRDELARHRVSHLQSTPSQARLLELDGAKGRGLTGLKRLLLGGEALPPELARSAVAAVPGEVRNMYGPTETTIWSLSHRVEARDAVAIGRPIVNTSAYLTGRDGRPVVADADGELELGGEGVVRGYLGRPGLTAERFVPDPWSDCPGARLYRTGDLARLSPRGEFYFLGRRDHQVKLRGFRIEFGEIEAVLERHAGVARAVVVLREDLGAEPGLVAYFVAPGEAPAAGELRAFLAEKLPSHMVPAFFVPLPELPLTPNKKIDRRALPAPSGHLAALDGRVAPCDPIEEVVAAIWGELLGRSGVGAGDHFLALGGHSLLAVQLVSRLESAFGLALPLAPLFETPTVEAMARFIARTRAGDAGPPEDPLPAVEPEPDRRHEPFPLTDVQYAYWVGRSGALELGSVSSHVYFELEAVDLDLDRLSSAVRRLIDRHEMLRAIVLPDGSQQILERVPEYEIAVLDLRDEGPETARAKWLEIRRTMSHQVLPSDRWPLFELRAARLAGDRVRVFVSLDLLIADAWSLRILERELRRLYRDPEAELPVFELSFRDYVTTEARLRGTAAHERALEYWRERLPTLPPAPELPLASSPAEVTAARFVRRSGRLPAATWRRLRSRATAAGLTQSGVLLAAFAEILGGWGKSPRFTLNLTLFNRLPLHPEVHRVVGDFTSLTLLAIDLSSREAFEDRALRVQRQLWDDLEHRLVSGVRVIRELARAESLSPQALMPVVFTSLLNLEAAGDATADRGVADRGPAGEGPAERIPGGDGYAITQTPQVWLDHQVREHAGELRYSWDAVEDLFPEGLLDAMFDAYGDLLSRLAGASDGAKDAWKTCLPAPVPPAQLALRAEVNATDRPVPAGLLHGAFRDRARARGAAPAVIARDRTITYSELLGGALRLGEWLRAEGARPERLVAVVMEKGWQQVLAVLGILESGAAYLPIDPALPRERRFHLLERGEVELALTRPSHAGSLEWPPGVRPLGVDEGLLAPPPEVLPESRQQAGQLAYVLFTSGSTGEPKGVMIEHCGAWNTVADVNRRFEVGPGDRVLALSSLSFDLSVYDVFGSLAAGAAIVVPAPGSERDPGHWAELVREHRVSIWNSVPALMELLVEHAAGPVELDLSSLRLLMWSGDWIAVDLPQRVREILARNGEPELISLGGATEASIWSILYPIGDVPEDWPSIPYGRPMDNQTFHVLDSHLEPRPAWVTGELYIGGVGLARGYWRDEEKTAGSFVETAAGERFYRTGDLGRYLPDGNIEFLGREDSQVKVGGHRIELGEVEAALHRLPEVRAAVAGAAGPDRHHRHLVAWVVSETPAATAAREPEPRGPAGKGLSELEFKLREPGRRRDLGDRPAFALPRPALDGDFLSPFRRRRSHREFDPAPFELEALRLLLESLDDAVLGRGAIEVLVDVKPGRITGLSAGVYRWQAEQRSFEPLAPAPQVKAEHQVAANRPIFDQAALALLLVARTDRLADAFGQRAEEVSLWLAGTVGQRLMERGPDRGLGFCPIGTLDFEPLRRACDLDGSHVLLHHFLGGAAAAGAGQGEELAVTPSRVRTAGPDEPSRPDLACKAAEEGSGGQVFLAGRLSLERLGTFLSCLMQSRLPEFALPKYRYPSAGNLYPVQTYLYVEPDHVAGLDGGFYYHDPAEHRLVQLSSDDPGPVAADAGGAAFALFLVGRPQAIEPVYGSLGHAFCHLEAGYMSELLENEARRAGIGLLPREDVAVEALAGPLALEGDQLLLRASLGGAVAAEALSQGPPVEQLRPIVERPPVAPHAGPASTGDSGLEERLRSGLRQILPEYMVPQSWVFLEALPLTSNGKVDRALLLRRLADEPVGGEASEAEDVAPRSAMERSLAALCREVLARDRIGLHQNFFSLGASSLELVRLHNRLQQQLGREIPVSVLFRHPTVASLGAALSPEAEREPTVAEQAAAVARKQKAAFRKQGLKARRRLRT